MIVKNDTSKAWTNCFIVFVLIPILIFLYVFVMVAAYHIAMGKFG